MSHMSESSTKTLTASSALCPTKTPISSSAIVNLPPGIMAMLSTLIKKLGVHTANYLLAAGFKYTGDGDKTKCDDCGLEISHWTTDMDPFKIHSEQRPECSFVRSVKDSPKLNKQSSASSLTTAGRNTSISNVQENPSKRQKTEIPYFDCLSNSLFEAPILVQVRRRTFSHWPHRTIPSSAQMVEAGFFNCNVGDRVICIYCNLICQQWTPHTDDPCEVHKTLSPNCIYVKSKLIRPAASSIVIVNESPTRPVTGNHSPTANNLDPLRSTEIVYTAACNPAYIEIPKRHASFATWPHENLPPVDDLVRSGFFYTGTKTIVTCFYCNGSLQNWGSSDNPMIEHARWFPHCAYAKQLCGDELYRKIQESKRAQQGIFKHKKILFLSIFDF
jgi:baculoviral IAP repeat-containing protein 2/3